MSHDPSTQYRISGRIADKQGRITHLQVEDVRIYAVDEMIKWMRDGRYTFYTTRPDNTKTPVGVRGKKIITSKGNETKEDNLDYLPVPSLI